MKTMQKGYPYDGVKSEEVFPAKCRVSFVMGDNGVLNETVDKEVYPGPLVKNSETAPFYISRCYDYS